MATNVLIAIIAPLVLLQLILQVVALVDIVRREPERVNGPKAIWVLIIIVGSMLGAVIYLVAGRKD